MRWVVRVAMLAAVVLVSTPALAGEKEVAAIKAVLTPGPLDTGLYADSFLKAVPPAQLDSTLKQVEGLIGPTVSVEPRGGQSYAVETATHEMPVEIALDADGRISGLFFRPPVAKNTSVDDLLKDLSRQAPQVAYLITKNGETAYSSGAEEPLAVGSAFKLGILKVLKDDIDAGRRKWTDVATLESGDVSLPTGVLQTWPVGSPLTLHTLASFMISISDNTATDALLRVVGRDKVEGALGIAPVITTRELFTLKAEPALKARYEAGDEAEKRAVLAEVDALPLPDVTKVLSPLDAGVEWYLSPQKLCQLLGEVADIDVFKINPGVANAADWSSIVFKGGSEMGAMSLNTRLVGKDGTVWCASAILNAPQALDETKMTTAYASIIAKLATGG